MSMGVYIKGMEMPKDVTLLAISPDGTVDIVHGEGDLTWKTLKDKAISVPSHGRLSDVDAFIEKCEEMADKEDGNQLDALVLLRWFLEQNAPTIIPASGGNENE